MAAPGLRVPNPGSGSCASRKRKTNRWRGSSGPGKLYQFLRPKFGLVLVRNWVFEGKIWQPPVRILGFRGVWPRSGESFRSNLFSDHRVIVKSGRPKETTLKMAEGMALKNWVFEAKITKICGPFFGGASRGLARQWVIRFVWLLRPDQPGANSSALSLSTTITFLLRDENQDLTSYRTLTERPGSGFDGAMIGRKLGRSSSLNLLQNLPGNQAKMISSAHQGYLREDNRCFARLRNVTNTVYGHVGGSHLPKDWNRTLPSSEDSSDAVLSLVHSVISGPSYYGAEL
ncbi:hypothetical protein K438DRAFT_2120428 [Mycena galopus ATCC 62051]|nr:hypothetical protein K438DRAFT_2120428 [Mycena galopus ATCC 62051]